MDHIYDMIIIGGGPGGYTAALYGARGGMDILVLERLSAGGQMALTEQIDNYPGFEDGIDGFILGEKMQQGAERFGAKTILADVREADFSLDIKRISTSEGDFFGKTVVIASGANPRELGLKNEKALVGRGVNYCAACDGMFYKDKTVLVVGGGNSAVADGSLLAGLCKKVILIHRRDELRATKAEVKALESFPNVELKLNTQITEFLFDERITGVKIKDNEGHEETLECDGVFISVGRNPATEFVKEWLDLDKSGYIIADETTKTVIPGVFAVGDVRTKPLRQVVTAVSDGACAFHFALEYINDKEWI